jgi:hypothetical protein
LNSNRQFIEENNTSQKRIKVLRALGFSDADPKSKELNIWDKRKWLALCDFWAGHTTEEHALKRVNGIIKEENDKLDARRGSDTQEAETET